MSNVIKKISFFFAVIIAGHICLTASGISQEPGDGREIQLKVKNQYAGNDQIWRWDMVLTNKTGYVRKRSAYRYMKDNAGLRKILIRFSSPADIRQTGLLTRENAGADDTQFLYLPALKKIRRIATNDKEQTFVGTDFNYEDLENLKVDNYTYSAARDDAREGKECYFYEATAKPGANTVYSRMRTWTDKESFIRVYVEYFDKKGQLVKIGTAKDIEQIDGIWTPLYISMESLADGHKTEIVTTNVVYNSGLSDELFEQLNLQTAALENL
ncbi:MAG: outer membrane lipoprotein-sorting protein [Candidatus Omnitrophica bacterium]|nr:outer membrane lipoprotein-sorting protein [Candidatus Omnitrophota bacterium]